MSIRPVLGSGSFRQQLEHGEGCLQGPTATSWQGGDSAPGLSVNVTKACPFGEDAAACPVPLRAPPPEGPQGRKHLVWSGCTRRLVPVWFPPPRSGFRHHSPAGRWARKTRQPGAGGTRPRGSSVAQACPHARVRERANGTGCRRKAHGCEHTAAASWPSGEPQALAPGA